MTATGTAKPLHGPMCTIGPDSITPGPEHTMADCEAELKTDPRYDRFRCAPTGWRCSCGRGFEHVCDEAEGCAWAMLDA
jgi:hypothetical protein